MSKGDKQRGNREQRKPKAKKTVKDPTSYRLDYASGSKGGLKAPPAKKG